MDKTEQYYREQFRRMSPEQKAEITEMFCKLAGVVSETEAELRTFLVDEIKKEPLPQEQRLQEDGQSI